ncbi:iron-siderophore ABC transporter substrate-binding protein [Leptolyngbya sp. AN02str]|uniref:iron-siderophore ABC transporter substrate-binding protein n=1 Tax=Leptolyngbya sp. AN02str TaxID=3423363 RepID=UPI003D31F3FC
MRCSGSNQSWTDVLGHEFSQLLGNCRKGVGRSLQRWGLNAGLALLTLTLVVACQRPAAMTPPSESQDCTVVEHVAGSVCVPNTIQRMVTLDGTAFEYAIAANLTPIGTVVPEFRRQLDALQLDVENIGRAGEPSIERILALKPDLIVGLNFHEIIYPQLSRIAPTLLVNFEHSGQWKSVFETMSAQLGQTAAAAAAMADYEARIAAFKAAMGDRLNDLQISVIRLYPETINLYLQDSFCGTVLQDAGLARPAAQAIGATEAKQRFGNEIQTSISRELLAQADGDVIFMWTAEDSATAEQSAQERLQQLQQDPLWSQLKAVKAGRVYRVPSYWIGSGPIAANAILDDLFQYLVEPS